jgi:hypothetical protein
VSKDFILKLYEDNKHAVVQWFQQPTAATGAFVEEVCWLVCKWDACNNDHMDYFLTPFIFSYRTILKHVSFEQSSYK